MTNEVEHVFGKLSVEALKINRLSREKRRLRADVAAAVENATKAYKDIEKLKKLLNEHGVTDQMIAAALATAI